MKIPERAKELYTIRIRLHLHMDQTQRNYSCTLDTSNKATRLLVPEILWAPIPGALARDSALLLLPPGATPRLGAISALRHSPPSGKAGLGYVISFHSYYSLQNQPFFFCLIALHGCSRVSLLSHYTVTLH